MLNRPSTRTAIAAALVAAMALPPLLPAGGQGPGAPSATTGLAPARSSRVNQAIQLQREAKHQLQELIQTMHQISQQLEKSDPATARAIAAAAGKAEEAFIADDMEKVIRLLQTGLVVPADATQGQVVQRLRLVLDTLRSGGDDLLARLIELEKMAAMMDAIQTVLRTQRGLERQSRALAFAEDVDAELSDVAKQAKALVAGQQNLIGRTKALSVDNLTQQLSAADASLYELLKRNDALIKAAADPYPSPEAMEANTAASRALSTEAVTVRVSIKTMLNTKEIAAAVKAAKAGEEAAAVEVSLGKMIDELNRSAKALQNDELENGQVAIAEGRTHLKAAMVSLEKAMSALPGAKAAVEVITGQQAILEGSEKLAPTLDRVAPVYEKKVGPAIHRNSAASLMTFAQAGGASATQGGSVGTQPPSSRPAVDATPPVLAALRRFDKEAAMAEQARLLESCELAAKRADAAVASVEALRKNPDFPRQQNEQQQVATRIAQLARGQVEPTDRPSSQPATHAAPSAVSAPSSVAVGTALPGTQPAGTQPAGTQPALPSFLSGELAVQMNKASDHAAIACKGLGDRKPVEANKEQLEVIRLLEQVLEKMQSDFEGFANAFALEFQEMVQADLERIILIQKRCSADTLGVWEKRQPDGTFKRTEILAMAAVAKAEGDIPPIMDHMLHLMATNKSAHAVVQFPPVCYLLLSMARADIDTVRSRLGENDSGPGTRRIQKDIEERLDGVKKALAKKDDKSSPPPQWGQNNWGQPESSRVDRIAEVQMMIVLQSQINRRTEELEALKKSGKGQPAAIEREGRDISRLQADVRNFVEKVIATDAAAQAKKVQ